MFYNFNQTTGKVQVSEGVLRTQVNMNTTLYYSIYDYRKQIVLSDVAD